MSSSMKLHDQAMLAFQSRNFRQAADLYREVWSYCKSMFEKSKAVNYRFEHTVVDVVGRVIVASRMILVLYELVRHNGSFCLTINAPSNIVTYHKQCMLLIVVYLRFRET